uniref:Uncharacterized protein n=1 Tax=Arundo donax TaxID=35708 RepID=A0A0A9CG11_ARUDO
MVGKVAPTLIFGFSLSIANLGSTFAMSSIGICASSICPTPSSPIVFILAASSSALNPKDTKIS